MSVFAYYAMHSKYLENGRKRDANDKNVYISMREQYDDGDGGASVILLVLKMIFILRTTQCTIQPTTVVFNYRAASMHQTVHTNLIAIKSEKKHAHTHTLQRQI